jgi:hypothetical protein
MTFFKKIFLFNILFILIFSSCKNDLKLNAPYKEYPSVYAILVPQNTIQMIRVNKIFLGEGDANKMAQVADSINYPAGELVITLERYLGGVKTVATPTGNKNIITFHDSIIQTAPGAFNTTQRVYVTSDKLFTWGDYELTITNTKTKNVFTSRTSALDSVKPSGLTPLCPPYYPVPLNNANQGNTSVYVNYGKPQNSYAIRFYPNEAILYQVTMRLHYFDSLLTGINKTAYADMPFTNQTNKEVSYVGSQGPFITNSFKGAEIYSTIAAAMEKNSLSTLSIAGRRMYKGEFIIYSSTQDYSDYLQFAAPSLSIAQDKPIYSNFNKRAAIGIFAFRARCTVVKELDAEFITQFAINANTCKYKFFQVPQMVLGVCP